MDKLNPEQQFLKDNHSKISIQWFANESDLDPESSFISWEDCVIMMELYKNSLLQTHQVKIKEDCGVIAKGTIAALALYLSEKIEKETGLYLHIIGKESIKSMERIDILLSNTTQQERPKEEESDCDCNKPLECICDYMTFGEHSRICHLYKQD